MSSSPDASQQPPGSPARPSTAAARTGGSGRPGADEGAVAVRVAVHIRPLVENELAKGCQEILDVAPNAQISVGQHAFAYDNVYGSGGGDSAANLYPDCVQPLVAGLFKGYNATVFAYGQTGSGKTFTMGSAWQPEEGNEGVIPNVMDELFTRVDTTQHTDFTIKVSFVEIHKEEVRDLLWTNSSAPRPVVTIRELPTGVSLAGAVEKLVRSREEMSHLLMQGTLMRAVAATNMNNRSSRSHAIFTITLEQRRRQLVRPVSAPAIVACTPGGTPMQDGDSSSSSSGSEGDEDDDDEQDEAEAGDEYLIAKMHLVDLAGSERAKRTGAEGARLKEAININKGLLALAKVITALVDAQSHVPYRDSKLTRLLQDSLGGNSRTVMIACVSPADINREETLNTLRYADRARRIKNKPVINRDPMAAQLAALRQQIAGLRAENLALRTALGGDREAAAALAAAGRAGQQGGVASEALQHAYDDLALRYGALEVDNAKQQIELDAARNEGELLRSGLLTAETQRDQLLLRLQSLQAAAAASSDAAMHAALSRDATAAALSQDAAADGHASSPVAAAADAETVAASDGGAAPAAVPEAAADAAAAVPTTIAQRAAAAGLLADVGVVAALRARVSELEGELRQVRSLHRMTSNVLVRGLSSSMRASNASGSRAASSSGGFGQRSASAAAVLGARPGSRLASAFPSLLEGGVSADADVMMAGGFVDAHHQHGDLDDAEDAGLASPVTPGRPSGLGGGDLLGDPLMEVAPDAEMLAQSAAHMVAREAMSLRLEVLARQMEAKQKRLMALQSAADMEGAKSKYMAELQRERDGLAKEKTALLQKLAAVTQASAEERKRLECAYKEKLSSVEKRLKDLAEREKAAKRSAAQLGRVQAVCGQLQSDIARMKAARAAVQRRMEAKEKEFREWRLQREREVLQLRRNAQRQDAALQQHQAMHCKQQAVLKRKTEEAEAARRKLRELMELQARVRRDKATAQAGALEAGGTARDVELQPNVAAPLLRNSKARRNWIDQEMELCSTSWQYQKVLDGELAQRADATRKLREVQKQLMLLGGLVPPSPVVTAAAAAASRRKSSGGPAAVLSLPEEDVLLQDAGRLQAAIDQHTRSVKELQEQWERAQAEEQSRGAGAADVRRWTGIRNIIEAREMLRTLFVSACAQRAQVYEAQMELAKLQESNDILEIRLDMALQQAAEARRKAVEAEATTAAVMATPARQLALVAADAGSSGSGSEPGNPVGSAPEPGQQQLVSSSSLRRRSSAAGAGDGAAAAAAAAGLHRRAGSLDGSAVAATPQDLGGGSIAGLSSDEVHRDETDIEADALLHSMGLPPIQEHPELQLQGGGGLPPAPAERTTDARGRLGARNARAWQTASSGSGAAAAAGAGASSSGGLGSSGVDSPRHSRTGALLRAAADGWVSQEGRAGNAGSASGGSTSGGRGRSTAAAAAAAQGLAAKLDALECDWQGYKRSTAAAGGGSARRSLSSGGLLRGGYSGGRSSSVPASPRVSGVGTALGSGSQVGSAARAANAQQQRGSRRVSLSANNSPVRQGEGPLHASRTEPFWQHHQQEEAAAAEAESGPDTAAATKAGAAAAAAAGNTGAKQQRQSLLMRGLGSILKLGRDAVAAASRGPSRSDDDASGGVAKSLNFLEADDSQQPGTAAGAGSSSAYTSASSSSGSSPEGHGRGGSGGGGARRAKKQPWRRRGRQPEAAADSADSDEGLFALSDARDGAVGDAAAAAAGGARGRQRHTAQQQQQASSGAELESASDAEDDDDDNEAADPSYDPVLHATPAAGRTRGARQAAAAAATGNGGRAARSTRASRASASSEQDGSRAGDSGGSSRRSSSSQQQQAQAQQSSGSLSGGSSAAAAAVPASGSAVAAGAAAAAGAGVVVAPPRALAAQVSFNHEMRQGWERPVLEAINSQRAGLGLAPVEKLTIQLLKEHMAGQQVDGRPWAPGNKSKDSLIAEYRRMLALTDGGDAETDIDRITGAANWPMPASHSLPCSPTPGGGGGGSSWAAAARRGADAEAAAAAAAAEGGGGRPQSGAAARRVTSASLPASPSGMLAGSPQRVLQQQHVSSSSIPAAGGVSPSQQQHQQQGASSSGNSPPSPGFGGASPRIAHASPRVVREWQAGSGGGSRVSRGGRMPLPGVLVQSAEGGLLQAGAAREQAGAALQQAAQRSLRSSLSGSSSKLKVALPNSVTDGPWSARGPAAPGGSGSAERSRSNSINASSGQPSWR